MQKFVATALIALTVASGAALAQTTAPSAPAGTPAPAATPAPAVKPSTPSTTSPMAAAPTRASELEPAVEAKFKAADKDNNGALDGGEVTAFKSDMPKIDADKDGKISRAEFAAAVKSGVIK